MFTNLLSFCYPFHALHAIFRNLLGQNQALNNKITFEQSNKITLILKFPYRFIKLFANFRLFHKMFDILQIKLLFHYLILILLLKECLII